MNPSQNPSAVRSKNEITDTLLHLMESVPYREITVKQIIMESHVARKTFYRNFHSKDDVLDAYIDSIMYQYIQSLQQIEGGTFSDLLDIILNFCMQYRKLLFILRDNKLMHLLLEKWNILIPTVHDQFAESGCVMYQSISSEQVPYVIAFTVGAVWNMIIKWIEYDMKDSPEHMKKILLQYMANLNE